MLNKKRYITYNKLRFIFLLVSSLIYSSSLLYSSGAYDNGTSNGKNNFGIDVTWNPFNYWENGQSYAVLSYGITNNFDIHGYYSIPPKGVHNYYMGIFYQFINYSYLDISSALGFRKYQNIEDTHIFFPQFLYTINLVNDIKLGGSIVNIIDINNNYKFKGRSFDIGIIIPVLKSKDLFVNINSIDFVMGAFFPAIKKVKDKIILYPTYSIDIKF